MNKPELLMPAGNPEKAEYALAYGADAIYAGLPQFSLRARENQFKDATLTETIAKVHGMGKKIYVTANLIAHNRKIHTYLKKIQSVIEAKPDALIMADPGLIAQTKENFPEMPIHLSVQANAMNWATVKFWQSQGIERIILSREVSIDEIKEIKDKVPGMEIEVFVHGALCMAHSGRCLLSSYFNKRDPNQGLCTNACRWDYKLYEKDTSKEYYLEEGGRPGEMMLIEEDESGTYIMNSKDLMAIDLVGQLIEAGVDSMKAEGRTKSIYYLSMTTQAYRRAIDDYCEGKPFDPSLADHLKKIHHRGYTSGFLSDNPPESMQNYEEGVSSQYTQDYVGQVIESHPHELIVEPRGKISLGDTIELVMPQKPSHHFKVEKLTLVSGKEVDVVNPGAGYQVRIPVALEDVSTKALLSKVLL